MLCTFLLLFLNFNLYILM